MSTHQIEKPVEVRRLARRVPQPKPAFQHPRHRGIAFSVIEDGGVWRWKVLPANPGLHAYEYSVAHGFRPTREAAEAAARAAIDMQHEA